MQKITNELYTSGKLSKADLVKHKIKYCIYLSGSPLDYKVDEVHHIRDGYDHNKQDRFIKILKSIDVQITKKNTPILLMCLGGISRSPTIAALYLFYNHTFKTFDESLEFVSKKSSLISSNPDLVDFIKEKVIPLIEVDNQMIR